MNERERNALLLGAPVTDEEFARTMPFQIVLVIILLVLMISFTYVHDKKENKEVQKIEQVGE